MTSAPIASRSTGMCGERVHGVDGDDGAHAVGPLGDGGHVVYGADSIGGQAYGYELGPFVDVPFEVFRFQGEGLGVYADPAHLRPLSRRRR